MDIDIGIDFDIDIVLYRPSIASYERRWPEIQHRVSQKLGLWIVESKTYISWSLLKLLSVSYVLIDWLIDW